MNIVFKCVWCGCISSEPNIKPCNPPDGDGHLFKHETTKEYSDNATFFFEMIGSRVDKLECGCRVVDGEKVVDCGGHGNTRSA